MHSLCGWYPVTVRVTTLKGPDAGKYYVERVGDYYLDRSEPAGLWLGKGAAELSLAGIVDDEIFLRVMGGEHPYGEQRPLGRCYGESSVRGFDVTLRHRSRYLSFSQSVTRWSAVRSSRRTTPPFTPWSAGRTARTHAMSHPWDIAVNDADGLITATFRQHTSRALDPQMHTHVVIANRVLGPGGRWLALDARTLKLDQRTLSALYHCGLRAELTTRLGVRWNDPEHGIAEMADVAPEVLATFSAVHSPSTDASTPSSNGSLIPSIVTRHHGSGGRLNVKQ